MKLANVSIRRPVFATVMIAVLVVFGLASYPTIGVDLFPGVDFPVVTITASVLVVMLPVLLFLRPAKGNVVSFPPTYVQMEPSLSFFISPGSALNFYRPRKR